MYGPRRFSRESRGLFDRPLPLATTLVLILTIAVAVEYLRYRLHPEMYATLQHPRRLAAASIIATAAYHVWNMPDTYAKIAASTFFTEASMPSVLVIGIVFLQQMAVAFVALLSNMIGSIPH